MIDATSMRYAAMTIEWAFDWLKRIKIEELDIASIPIVNITNKRRPFRLYF